MTDEKSLAQEEARAVQQRFPDLFVSVPVRASSVARALGFELVKRPALKQRARLEVFLHSGARTATIALQPNLDRNVGRFAIAHEIGHAILLANHPALAREWGLRRREEFANVFAAELLLASTARAWAVKQFREIQDPRDLVRFAANLGLSSRALLTLANREQGWFADLDRFWLRVRFAENLVKGFDACLRIVNAYYDRRRFFIPFNQSIRSFAGDDGWLGCLRYGEAAHHETPIAVKLRRADSDKPKFLKASLRSQLCAVRLRPSPDLPSDYLLVLAMPTESHARWAFHSAAEQVKDPTSLRSDAETMCNSR